MSATSAGRPGCRCVIAWVVVGVIALVLALAIFQSTALVIIAALVA